MTKMIPIQCYFRSAELAALQSHAEARGTSAAAVIRESVRQYLSPPVQLLVALEEARPGSLEKLGRGEAVTLRVDP